MSEAKKVSLQTLRAAVPSIQELMKETTIPPTLRFSLARSIQKLDEVLKPLESTLEGIQLAYVDKKTQRIKKGQEQKFLAEQNKFLKETIVDVDLPDIPEEYIVETTTDHLFLLLPIINFTEKEEPEPKKK